MIYSKENKNSSTVDHIKLFILNQIKGIYFKSEKISFCFGWNKYSRNSSFFFKNKNFYYINYEKFNNIQLTIYD